MPLSRCFVSWGSCLAIKLKGKSCRGEFSSTQFSFKINALSGQGFNLDLVSKPKSKAEKERKHQKGSWETSPQCPPCNLLWWTHSVEWLKIKGEVSDLINLQLNWTNLKDFHSRIEQDDDKDWQKQLSDEHESWERKELR